MFSETQVDVFYKNLSSGGSGLASRNTMKFMCRGFTLVLDKTEVEVSYAIRTGSKTAHKFWVERIGQKNDLNNAREACWDFLERKGRGAYIKDKEDAIARALLCVLHPDEIEDEDFRRESFEWFFKMVDKVGEFQPLFESIFRDMKRSELSIRSRRPKDDFSPN